MYRVDADREAQGKVNQRIAQINGSLPQFNFVYDEAGHQTGKYDGGGRPLWETAWLGDLSVAALTPPAGRFYIAPDHLGSPHQITAAGGALAWLWNSDPFGNGDALGGPYGLRFPGQYFDQATKLHYNMARDYDPRTGRYIESDPIGLIPGVGSSEAIPAFVRSYFSRIPLAKRVAMGNQSALRLAGNDPIALIDPLWFVWHR